jgi:hypothetical protein
MAALPIAAFSTWRSVRSLTGNVPFSTNPRPQSDRALLERVKAAIDKAVSSHAKGLPEETRHDIRQEALAAALGHAPEEWAITTDLCEDLSDRASGYAYRAARNRIAEEIAYLREWRKAQAAEAQASASMSEADRDDYVTRAAGWVRRHLTARELEGAIDDIHQRGYRLRPERTWTESATMGVAAVDDEDHGPAASGGVDYPSVVARMNVSHPIRRRRETAARAPGTRGEAGFYLAVDVATAEELALKTAALKWCEILWSDRFGEEPPLAIARAALAETPAVHPVAAAHCDRVLEIAQRSEDQHFVALVRKRRRAAGDRRRSTPLSRLAAWFDARDWSHVLGRYPDGTPRRLSNEELGWLAILAGWWPTLALRFEEDDPKPMVEGVIDLAADAARKAQRRHGTPGQRRGPAKKSGPVSEQKVLDGDVESERRESARSSARG